MTPHRGCCREKLGSQDLKLFICDRECSNFIRYQLYVILNEVKSSQQAGITTTLSLTIWYSVSWILLFVQDDIRV